MAETTDTKNAAVTIKKYANRRLYNTATSSYVTLDHLCQMVKDGTDFVVYDAKTGEDITRSVLTQIIVEEEGKGQNLLPISFLRHLITFYGDSLGGLVPRYLDHSMQAFAHNEQQMRNMMQQALEGMFPFNPFEELGKQNMAFFENAMKMFAPFYPNDDGASAGGERRAATPGPAASANASTAFQELQSRLNAMQRQLDELSGGKETKVESGSKKG